MANDYRSNEAEEKRVGQWSELQLWRMNKNFCERMTEVIEREQRDAAKDKANAK